MLIVNYMSTIIILIASVSKGEEKLEREDRQDAQQTEEEENDVLHSKL